MEKNRLILECENDKLSSVANAVYEVLGQTEMLKAEVVFVSAEEIQRLNRETRNIDKVTDVLSYPSLDEVKGKTLDATDYPYDVEDGVLFIGSIVLCVDRIEEQAKELGHSTEREMQYLVVHGLMHLFGYDHINDDDKAEMRIQEKKAMKLLGVEE